MDQEHEIDGGGLPHLTAEQVRTWTRGQKDRWWRDNVFLGDAPQLTLRAALTGMVLGAALSLTNVYVGYKTGWGLGVGITSVILSFALFSIMAKVGLTAPMTLLENNAMQSIATSAGYVAAPLFSSLGAYSMITGYVLPAHQAILWMALVSVLGVLFAFPLKRRYINDEQHDFPEGKAAGVVMKSLHTVGAGIMVRLLTISMVGTAILSFFKEEGLLKRFGGAWTRFSIPELMDVPFWKLIGWSPTVRGISFEKLTIGVESDFPLIAAGGLMRIRTGVSLLVGAVVNYFFLVPWLITQGIIEDGGYRNIAKWTVWFGAAIMTSASLTSFFSAPNFLGAFRGFSGKKREDDVLADVELPLVVSWVGIPVVGIMVAILTHLYFGVPIWAGLLAIPLIGALTLVAVHSTALTSITPTGAIGKLTQLSFSAVAPGHALTNLMAAGVAGEAVGNAANLLMDIKPGYMLGAKPRQQAFGHILGIFAGSIASVYVWYHLFGRDVTRLGTTEFPLPGAVAWKAIAEALAGGLSGIHPTARLALALGLVLGIALELVSKRSKDRFPISAVGLGLAFVMPFTNSLSMFLGCTAFWIVGRLTEKRSWINRVVVGNQEVICGGAVAGGSVSSIVFKLLS